MKFQRPQAAEGDECPSCKIGTMTKRIGKYGEFLGCTQYPRCGFVGKIPSQANTADQKTETWLRSRGLEIEPVI